MAGVTLRFVIVGFEEYWRAVSKPRGGRGVLSQRACVGCF